MKCHIFILKPLVVTLFMFLFAFTLKAQSNSIYYIRQTNPWGKDLKTYLDQAYGANNYTVATYSINPSTLFANTTSIIYLEGSDTQNPAAMNNFMNANRTMMENWVQNGGHLLLNAAPNEGGNINFGFGGVTLNYPRLAGSVFITPGKEDHPIFHQPNNDVGNSWGGNYFSHGSVSGNGIIPLISGNVSGTVQTVFAQMGYGNGLVLFGGMTTPNFHTPQPAADHLFVNILSYLTSTLPPVTWYRDADSDGYGNLNITTSNPVKPEGYVAEGTDCDDNDNTVYPGAFELCDGKDNDCNGLTDDDCSEAIYLSINDLAKYEGDSSKTNMKFYVFLSKKSTKPITVDYYTVDREAVSPSDFVAKTGTLSIAPGEKHQTLVIKVKGEKRVEGDETFSVVLTNPHNAFLKKSTGTGTILNDDGINVARQAPPAGKTAAVQPGTSVRVFPSPAASTMNVQISGYSGKVTLQLMDLQGKVMKRQTTEVFGVKASMLHINVANIAGGTYLLEIKDEKGNKQTSKVIVSH